MFKNKLDVGTMQLVSSNIKPMSEHSEAEKSVKSILSATCISYLERTDKNTSTCTTNQR